MADDAMADEDADRTSTRDLDRLIAERVRLGLWVCVAGVVLFAVADLRLAPRGLLPRLFTLKLVNLTAIGVGLRLARDPMLVRPTAVGLSVCAMLCVSTVASGLTSDTHELTELLLLVLCICAAVLVPWGAGPQAVLVTVAMAGIVLGARASTAQRDALDDYRLVMVLVGFIASVSLARGVARQHDARDRAERVRLERARVEHGRRLLQLEAQVAATLARVGREMIASLDAPVLHQRLCALTAETFACDVSCTVLERPDGTSFGVAAADGPAAEADALRALALPAPPMAPLLARLARDDVVYGAVSELLPAALGDRLAAAYVLCLALRRRGEVIGVQLCARRSAIAPFGVRERRIAGGIAQLASMALENARLVAELGRASRLKSEFVSTMSHELRTPLNVILGYIEMLADEEIDITVRRSVHGRAVSAGRDLLQLIEGTLDVSRIEAGRDQPRIEPVELRALWRSLHASCADLPRSPAVTLDWDEQIPERIVQTDPHKLRVIVRNLVANACKFTERGRVAVSARCDDRELWLQVADTGIGIAPEHRATVFEMFQQIDGTETRRHGGSGLGLYIVRRFTEQLDGRVFLDSAPQHGSRFTVVLPLRHGGVDVVVPPPRAVSQATGWDAR